MSTTIQDKNTATKDSSEVLLYVFDYDAENLAVGVELATFGTFVITRDEAVVTTELTQASQAFVTGNRKVRVLLGSGTRGATYRIEHTAQTNETPAQTKSKWFRLQID